MVKKKGTKVPDAWEDDDWESQADRAAATATADEEAELESRAPLSKAERLAQHAESNKKLWESAEAPPPPTYHYVAARSTPPLATEFKPAVRVLSRKPAPQTIAKRDPVTGALSRLTLDDADEDEDDGSRNRVQMSPEEVRAKQQREREEKQRRYDEARAKIFGTGTPGSNPSSGASTPGTVTPPRSGDGSSRGQRGRGRGGRGGGGAGGAAQRPGSQPGNQRYMNENRGESAQRPGSQAGGRELYDPNYSPKPGFQLDRRGGGGSSQGGAPLSSGRPTPREDDQVIRAPRGPDASGRGFSKRGAKDS